MSLINRPISLGVLGLLGKRRLSVTQLLEEMPDLTSSMAYRYTNELVEMGAVAQRPRPGAGRVLDLVITDYGHSLHDLGDLFRDWFRLWPYSWGSMTFESELGQIVISSKVEGWGHQILWEVEREPRTMGWLESRLGASREAQVWGFGSAAQIRHRVQLMERTGQIEVVDPTEKPVRYRPTLWSYRGAGCLAHAIASELHYRPPNYKEPSVRTIAFGLVQAGHVIQAPKEVEGTIQVSIPLEGRKEAIAIHYEIEGGRMLRWDWGSAPNPKAAGRGPLINWIGPMLGLKYERPVVSGDPAFFNAVLAGAKQGLFLPELGFSI